MGLYDVMKNDRVLARGNQGCEKLKVLIFGKGWQEKREGFFRKI
jgi:hypothetical protein